MKDLLYLKDEHLKEFIEKLFIGYRESFGDAKKTLDKYSLGIAHHKVIHIISIHEGITISNLLKKLGYTARDLLRKGEDVYKNENLSDESLTEDFLIDMMLKNPILIERPIVVSNGKAVIGRPPEKVLEIL